MYIRDIKQKEYSKVSKWLINNSYSEPLSSIHQVDIDFNQKKYKLKIFIDTKNKLVALEAVKYEFDLKSNNNNYFEIRKNNILGAMIEMLLFQCNEM